MSESVFLPHAESQRLFDALTQAGYPVLAPQVQDGAIVYRSMSHASGLPWGVHDTQAPGEYRLQQDSNPRAFAWANGPQALKPMLFAPTETLWRVARDAQGHLQFTPHAPAAQKRAVLGMRPCDLAALAIHDAHFLGGEADGHYAARREGLLCIVVNCTHPASTCFCASTGDGPTARQGYDLLLDELDDGFVIRSGSEAGAGILQSLALPVADATQLEQSGAQHQLALSRQQRSLPAGNLQAPLFANLQHPRWQQVAARCLACGNCTSVCPTCFCHDEREQPALDGHSSEHLREWDSCFTAGHSYIHGTVVRATGDQRYRQWLTHKLGSWHEQFGRSGCVGCGRCISWCPVGIDITEEATALCGDEQGGAA